MKIGLIYKHEPYQSLNMLNMDIVSALKDRHDTKICILGDEKNIDEKIGKLYSNVDVVINTSSKLINYKRTKPTIFFGHAWMDHGAGVNLYYCNSFLSSDMLVFASSSALKKYKYVYTKGVAAELLPYFSSIARPDITKEEELSLKKKYSIPVEKKILVYFGRLCGEKNIEKVIDLYLELERKDICLLLIGQYSNIYTYGFGDKNTVSTYKQKIEKKIKKNKDIIVIDGVDREILLKLLDISYIAINLTNCYEEDFGLSTIEAMKLGLPVIGSDRGGLKDTIVHKETGFLIKTKLLAFESIGLIRKEAIPFINSLLDNQKKYCRISINAKKRAENLYGEKAFSEKLKIIINYINNHNKAKKNKNNYQTLVPLQRIKKIFDKEIEANNIKNIYKTNPNLFKKLYQFYTSSG